MGLLKMVGVAGMILAVGGCQSGGTGAGGGGTGGKGVAAVDGDARAFEGTIVSLRPTTNTMLISKGKNLDELNIVQCKWDAKTRFFLDDKETDLTQIQQYMTVQVKGRMVEGEMVMGEARFSSKLPANVRPASRPAE